MSFTSEIKLSEASYAYMLRPFAFAVSTKLYIADDGQVKSFIASLKLQRLTNDLKPCDNFSEYFLTELPEYVDVHDTSFCEKLLPWSEQLP